MEENKIPEIKIENNGIALPTLDVPILINGETKLVKMQKLSAGMRRDALRKHVNTSISGQQISGRIEDVLGMQISILSKSILDAPFDKSEKGLENLPDEVIDYLYQSYESGFKKKLTTQ